MEQSGIDNEIHENNKTEIINNRQLLWILYFPSNNLGIAPSSYELKWNWNTKFQISSTSTRSKYIAGFVLNNKRKINLKFKKKQGTKWN